MFVKYSAVTFIFDMSVCPHGTQLRLCRLWLHFNHHPFTDSSGIHFMSIPTSEMYFIISGQAVARKVSKNTTKGICHEHRWVQTYVIHYTTESQVVWH